MLYPGSQGAAASEDSRDISEVARGKLQETQKKYEALVTLSEYQGEAQALAGKLMADNSVSVVWATTEIISALFYELNADVKLCTTDLSSARTAQTAVRKQEARRNGRRVVARDEQIAQE